MKPWRQDNEIRNTTWEIYHVKGHEQLQEMRLLHKMPATTHFSGLLWEPSHQGPENSNTEYEAQKSKWSSNYKQRISNESNYAHLLSVPLVDTTWKPVENTGKMLKPNVENPSRTTNYN